MNALDPAMFRAIAGSDAQFRDDRGSRAVVLSGEGRAFCAGLDFERVAAVARDSSLLPFADLAERTHGICNWAQHIVWLWRELPVIAAVHGSPSGAASTSSSAPICATSRRTRFSRLWKPNGTWCRKWPEPSACAACA
jgi:enoyl-CoA hydratase/carnithine racemase